LRTGISLQPAGDHVSARRFRRSRAPRSRAPHPGLDRRWRRAGPERDRSERRPGGREGAGVGDPPDRQPRTCVRSRGPLQQVAAGRACDAQRFALTGLVDAGDERGQRPPVRDLVELGKLLGAHDELRQSGTTPRHGAGQSCGSARINQAMVQTRVTGTCTGTNGAIGEVTQSGHVVCNPSASQELGARRPEPE
jgi:hypothetical protein